jgi:hypothetical protein
MTAPIIKEGVAVLYPNTGGENDPGRAHRIVVVGETKDGDLLLVPICSQHANCDKTCTISPNESWASVTRDSYAAYYVMKRTTRKALESQINDGRVTYIGEVPPDIYGKIKAGILRSKETSPKFQKYYKEAEEVAAEKAKKLK